MWSNNGSTAAGSSPQHNTTSTTESSSAFSRLNRPGSGRDQQNSSWAADNKNREAISSSSSSGSNNNNINNGNNHPSSSSGGKNSSPKHSLSSNTSPTAANAQASSSSSGGGLVPEHRINRPANLPHPGGGRIPVSLIASPEQQERRLGLKISFSQPNMRKSLSLGPFSATSKKQLYSPPAEFNHASSSSCHDRLLVYRSAHSTGKLKLPGHAEEFDFKAEDLVDHGEIGRGAFGTVNKMIFNKTGDVTAVKRIRSTVEEKEQKELLMDLDVVMKSANCPYIVKFFGAIFKEGDCWICMEIMDISTDKFYKFIYEELKDRIDEKMIGKITVATVLALNYLKEKLKIIHRDVKPSSILLDKGGHIKLCDFGISGRLVDSIAKTRDAGCRPYMAPERIDPQRNGGYDVRSDVWSLGITLIELATGRFPYPKWNSVFEQLQQVVHGEAPKLENEAAFTDPFVNFVNTCLIKEESKRPKYAKLLEHPFIVRSEAESFNVSEYVNHFFERWNNRQDANMDTS